MKQIVEKLEEIEGDTITQQDYLLIDLLFSDILFNANKALKPKDYATLIQKEDTTKDTLLALWNQEKPLTKTTLTELKKLLLHNESPDNLSLPEPTVETYEEAREQLTMDSVPDQVKEDFKEKIHHRSQTLEKSTDSPQKIENIQ